MSDDDLYKIAGLRLIQGKSAFSINPEVPPLAKYLYGLGIIWWSNPYLISGLIFVLSIIFYYVLTIDLLDNKHALMATLFFTTSPIFSQQISQTMLDLPQLFFLIGHTWSIIQNKETTKAKYLLLAGLFLGLFASCKVPVIIIPILLADFLYLLKVDPKRIILFFLIPIIASGVYYLSYFPTIYTQNLSIIDWIKNQLWIVNFYKSSNVKTSPIYYLITIFTGFYKGWWKSGKWEYTKEWTILWPITLLAAFFGLKESFLKFFTKNKKIAAIDYITYLLFFLLILWLFIPFWARYFLLALPFSILIFVNLFKNEKKYTFFFQLHLSGQF